MCVSWIWEGARGGGGAEGGGGGGGERSPEEEEEPEEGEPLIHFHSAYLPLAGLARARDFGPVSPTASRSPASEAWAIALSGDLGAFVLACGDLGFAPLSVTVFPPLLHLWVCKWRPTTPTARPGAPRLPDSAAPWAAAAGAKGPPRATLPVHAAFRGSSPALRSCFWTRVRTELETFFPLFSFSFFFFFFEKREFRPK